MVKLYQMFRACSLWSWLGLPLAVLHCNMLCTSGFVDNVILTLWTYGGSCVFLSGNRIQLA